MIFSDIIKLNDSTGDIETLATYSLPGNQTLNAYLNQELKGNKNTYQWKDNISPAITQSKHNSRIWSLPERENGDIISAIERLN